MIHKLTLADKLAAAGYRPSGFDYLRLVLAVGVVLFHTVVTSYGWQEQAALGASQWRPLLAATVPLFFALSGFLVAGSLDHSKHLVTFGGLRLLRIVPALGGVVCFSAFIIGPALTDLPLADYFTAAEFRKYFLNIVAHIHYELPGVFESNPMPRTVNGQLWTIPWELVCYALCAVLALLGIFRRPAWLYGVVVLFYAAHAANLIDKLFIHPTRWVHGGVNGHTLVMIFVTGMLLYRCRDRIPHRRRLCILSIVIAAILLAVPPYGDGFIALPIAYLAAYVGVMNPPRHRYVLSGDYSYGIFLYGYPIQQIVASVPAWQHWYVNLAISVPCICLMAVLSWWLVEKPCLAQRGHLKRLEDRYLTKRVPA